MTYVLNMWNTYVLTISDDLGAIQELKEIFSQ